MPDSGLPWLIRYCPPHLEPVTTPTLPISCTPVAFQYCHDAICCRAKLGTSLSVTKSPYLLRKKVSMHFWRSPLHNPSGSLVPTGFCPTHPYVLTPANSPNGSLSL